MHTPDLREWLLTNGLGSLASGTISDARTRTYHGWFVVATQAPDQRTLLLSHLDASLEIGEQVFALGTNFWTGETVDPEGYQFFKSFTRQPNPTWVWGTDEWQLSRQLVMPEGDRNWNRVWDAGEAGGDGEGTTTSHASCVMHDASLAEDQGHTSPLLKGTGTEDESKSNISQRLLIHYHYFGKEAAVLRLRPIIGDRDVHHTQKQSPNLTFAQIVGHHRLLLQSFYKGKPGTPWTLHWSHGHYQVDEAWYWNYFYPEEASRGLDYSEDLYSPGYFTVLLAPNERVIFTASLGLQQEELSELKEEEAIADALQPSRASEPSDASVTNFRQVLMQSCDQFVVEPLPGNPAILAGYPWFGLATRDMLLSIPGFFLARQQFSQARQLLERLGSFCYQGLLPDSLPTAETSPVYTNMDCSLWWIEMLGLYLETTQDWQFLQQQYSVVKRIYKAFTVGTLYNIRVDASDGLITWEDLRMPLTWMNAQIEARPVTPRQGKPVEINALWYSALCWASQWAAQLGANPELGNGDPLSNQARRYTRQAEQVKSSLGKFWNARQGYLFDRIDPEDRCDRAIRPNAILAISLHHCAFMPEQAQQILQVARDRLLTSYGLRTLEPQDYSYRAEYDGDLYHRELAYHQGTVWTWLLGPFLRAWHRFFPQEPLPFDWHPLIAHFYHQGCLGTISELFDGESPHHPRGAIAHALATAELVRVLQELS